MHGVHSLSTNGRVLSIQSSVVHGYVGGKCAIFALQLNGFDVDPIHSVQFSNHTGYPHIRGHAFDGDHLLSLLSGLESNNITKYTHLLTGFIGSKSLLEAVKSVASKLNEWNGDSFEYLMDPVMGDEGRLYVKPDLVEAFRDNISLATILVPNAYEAGLLTDIDINNVGDGFRACEALHSKGPHTIVITSFPDGDEIVLLASTTKLQDLNKPNKITLRVPRIRAYFTGTGDLLAALLLAALSRHPSNLAAAIEESVSSLQAVLSDTVHSCGEASYSSERTSEVCKARELRLIQNRHHIMSAPTPSPYQAVPWENI